MGFMESTMLHHAAIVLLFLWLLSAFNCCHPIAYLFCLIYLYLVHERFVMRLRRKLQYEERRQGNQRRVLTDSETVRWLNHAVEKIWPICMEHIASQNIFLPIIPWFLEKYKPWTAKRVLVQHLYLGRNPPIFTEMRVLSESSEDDHLILELGMNFLTADDMSAILAVKLRKRLGFGMWARLHLTGMHVEGKVLVGVKFIQTWPFVSRLRLCFAEPPYFQMTVKPIFTHGLDVTVLPGIAGWLANDILIIDGAEVMRKYLHIDNLPNNFSPLNQDKLLSIAFEQTLVEPNMLVVDMEKFVCPHPTESWFSVDVKEPVAYAKLEVIEASEMKPSDLNGLADPYVKGQLGLYRFKTKIQRKTLSPKWQQEFNIPIVSWDSQNVLAIEVRDKDHFLDDLLGVCSINITDMRDGQRHDMWLPLQNVKTGRLHLVVTIFEENGKVDDQNSKPEAKMFEPLKGGVLLPSVSSTKSKIIADNFEPINVEGQKNTGIWVQQPGSEISKTWEPRKGKSRRLDNKVEGKANDSIKITALSGTLSKDSDSSGDENPDEKHRMKTVRKGLRKISSLFHRSPKKDEHVMSSIEAVRSPYSNVRAVHAKVGGGGGVKLIVEEKVVLEEKLTVAGLHKVAKIGKTSSEESDPESPSKDDPKTKSRNIFRQVFARKRSRSLPGRSSRRRGRDDSDLSEDEDYESILPSPGPPDIEDITHVPGQMIKPNSNRTSEGSSDGFEKVDYKDNNNSHVDK